MLKQVIELSPQQSTILRLSWNGLSIKETAAWMGLSPKTVKNYRQDLYRKFGVRNVEGMLRQGLERGLINLKPRHNEEWP